MRRFWFDPCERCGAPVRFADELSRSGGSLGLIRRCTEECTSQRERQELGQSA